MAVTGGSSHAPASNLRAMTTPLFDPRRRRLAFWVLHTLGWSLYGLIYVLLYASGRMTDARAVGGIAITYCLGFSVSLGLRWLYRRIRYTVRSIGVIALAVFVAVVIAAQLWYWLDVGVSYFLVGIDPARFVLPFQQYVGRIYGLAFVLVTWSALYFGILLWYEWREERARTERARLLAQSAQLQMLRYQINPHFLFNALNSIRALVDNDRQKARAMVTALSDFLRYTLDQTKDGNVLLEDEIGAIRRYFEIERIRYEEKLQVTFEIDPRAARAPVPAFLVHPLVENAVKHGMRTSPMPLVIRVSAALRDGELEIDVWNSGSLNASAPGAGHEGTQTGLQNIRRRLEHVFPSRHRFGIREDGGGVRATIAIRLEEDPDHAPGRAQGIDRR